MAADHPSTDLLRRAFRDISVGHTRATILGRPGYIKHLSHSDQVDLDTRREEFYEQARANGISTEAEREVELRAAGQWTDAKDQDLTRAKQYLEGLYEGKRSAAIKMPSMVKEYLRKIADAEKDYRDKLIAKKELLGVTCEFWADREINDHYILTNLFSDAALTVPLFRDDSESDEFNYMGIEETNQISEDYRRAMEGCSDANLKRLAIQPFFQRYFGITGDSIIDFFGRPVAAMTFYQVDLLRYAAHFRAIFQNHDTRQFPKEVQEDPDMLTEYAASASKAKDDLAKSGAYEEGTVVVGMKPEDAKATGVRAADPMKEIKERFGGNVMNWAAANAR